MAVRKPPPEKAEVAEAITRAASWAAGPEFIPEDADLRSYRISHEALRQLFAKLDFGDRMGVLAAANACYGWMPTILDVVNLDGITEHRRELERLRASTSAGAAMAEVASWGDALRTELFKSVNNSLVGSSKFMHFLNPGAIPIWDSRVASTFGGRVGSWPDYLTYWQAVAEAAAKGVGPPAQFNEFLNQVIEGAPPRPPASDIRALEFMLFHYGRWLMDKARVEKKHAKPGAKT